MIDGEAPLTNRLNEELRAKKNVMWIVTGGSNITLSTAVMKEIDESLSKNLSIYLTDERFGEVNHADSNAKQLRDAGFEPKKARVVEVLSPGLDFKGTCEQYALSIATAFEAADIVIAQIGMGPDGHILGVLPGSPAVNSSELVVGYKSKPHTRITLTLQAMIAHVDAAYVFTFGEERREALENLLHLNLTPSEQPAQALKQLPEVYVYNDLIEGKA